MLQQRTNKELLGVTIQVQRQDKGNLSSKKGMP